MITLGIETSCDETALCLLETQEKGGGFEYRILGNIVHSQIDVHKEYGGVFPMLAKREHIKNLPILYEKILKDSGIKENQISRVAVTRGPGLEPALWTGILFAQELGKRLSIPVIPINHMEGHIMGSLLSKSEAHDDFQNLLHVNFPALAVLISGGHTEIVEIKQLGEYTVLGSTVDDAVGEAFDKVARMLGLPYPGGPEISKLAETARKDNIENKIKLPRPMLHSKNLNFSFSGLKTAVLYTLREIPEINLEQKQDISREFENAVTDVIISKTRTAIEEYGPQTLIIGGGVIANKFMRLSFENLAKEHSIPLYMPALGLSGDNALMIAIVGAAKDPNSNTELRAEGNLSL
jgi:N6-L-threonylcarbamoyladenine synthase